MSVVKYMLANLKKRKSYSVVICMLAFLAGLILTVTLSTALNLFKAYDNAYTTILGPHLMYWLPEANYTPELKDWFASQPGVKAVSTKQERFVVGAELQHEDTVLRSNVVLHLLVYDPQDTMRLVDVKYDPKTELTQGDIYLPYIYKTGNGLAVGDTVDYVFGSQSMTYTVAGFVEEPLFGAELHGIKLLFLSEADMAALEQTGGENVVRNQQIRVRLTNYSESAVQAIVKDFNLEVNENTGSAYTYGTFANGHLTLPKISLVVMIAFVFILCTITITILRYAILATIEADFTDIGILKALGFTPYMVQSAIIGQYASLAIFSGALSLLAAYFITPVVGNVVLASSGLYYSVQLSAPIGATTLAVLLIVITVFSAITARRAKRISPVQAIAQGVASVYFSSRVNVKLEKIGIVPFNLRMALKQILTKSKRYVLLLVVSALLSYTLVFLLGLVQLFNSEKSLNMLGGALSDIRVTAADRQTTADVVSQIQKDYPTDWVAFQKTTQLVVEGNKTTVRVMDDFESSGELYSTSGRHPLHVNEVSLSELLAKGMQKGVGDQLVIKGINGKEYLFLITGLFQTIDDGGTYIRMPESAIMTINPEFQLNIAYVKLISHDNLDRMIEEMRHRYIGYEELANERKFTNDKLITIQDVFSQISWFVFALSVVIISFITLLIVKITVYSETRELGIFKALGFSSGRLRLQLALRFLIITLFGGVIGVAAESLFGSKLFSLLMKGFGLSSIMMDFSLRYAVIAVTTITAIAMISAMISSRNIKRVSAYTLIKE
ncbi:MAG: ABC transporter permease [Bacillota bacterium]|nr:ABC transporter permease [Bacillota bacterium]